MGIDCEVKVGDKYTSLDRWYVFSPPIESGREMTRSGALAIIRKLNRTRTLTSRTSVLGNPRDEIFRYHRHWLLEARKAIKLASKDDAVVFYRDC